MLRYLLLLLLLLSSCALTSCRTPRYIPMPETHSRDSLSTRVNKYVDSTIIDRSHTEKLHRGADLACSFRGADTLVIHDSVFVKTYRYLSQHDTIRIVERDSVPYAVEVPVEVEKPVPRFYKGCTIGFFALLLGGVILFLLSRIREF